MGEISAYLNVDRKSFLKRDHTDNSSEMEAITESMSLGRQHVVGN